MQKSTFSVIIKVLLILLVGVNLSYMQSLAKVGTVGSQFLKVGMSARGIGLSGTGNTRYDDAGAIFYNPAGLNFISPQSFVFSKVSWLADMDFVATAIAFKLRTINLGLHVVSFNSGEIEETTVLEQQGTGRTFSANSWAVGITGARMLTDYFGVGLTVKAFYEDYLKGLDYGNGFGTGVGWAIDIGTVYLTNFRNMSFGMVIRNFGPDFKIKGEYQDYDNGEILEGKEKFRSHPIPLQFRFGISIDAIRLPNIVAVLNADLVHPNDNLTHVDLGMEVNLFNLLFLRGGYAIGDNNVSDIEFQGYDSRGLTSGFGIHVPLGKYLLKVDYAVADYRVLNYIHTINVIFDLK